MHPSRFRPVSRSTHHDSRTIKRIGTQCIAQHDQRSRFVLGVMLFAFIALALRAFWIQIAHHDFYTLQGQKRYQSTIELHTMRGRIVDRHGATLAISLPSYEVWANPQEIASSNYEALAKSLDLHPTTLISRLHNNHSTILLKKQVDVATAKHLEELEIKGITLVSDTKRYYPEGESVSHIVGFTNIDDQGQEGVELSANSLLTGVSGQRKVIHDRLGRIISDVDPTVPASPGATVELTIDRRIQQITMCALSLAVNKHHAQAGSAVVLNAQTGEILALANYPSFDPNDRIHLGGAPLRNRAVVDTFEPGSTIKPIIVALSLDQNTVTPETTINTTPGTFKIGPAVIHDTSNHGVITIAQALQKSSNIALAKLALRLPARTIWETYQRYGIGQTPQLHFPGAASGRVRLYTHWHPIEQATMAYGYGLSVSLLQLAQLYTAYAGDGTLHPASLIHRADAAPPAGARVTTPSSAAAIRTMLEMAVNASGTGRTAQVARYRVGGKTGTARKQVGRTYARNKYRALFVGMAPIAQPRLIIAIMIDEPHSQSYYGGAVAGPVFASIVAESLPMLGVAPDSTATLTSINHSPTRNQRDQPPSPDQSRNEIHSGTSRPI
ncbi:penicillin-binding protein 2 [Burkholderia sp. MS455]|uniref:peptidoglycan D,D-transpeptidase FtsI family protein n=1 Tax=Burkholderia sp. MS455 TaxID=2811788 RepID=UPI00195DC738|nr:penicillin-binding protein 2 [Burkholderia sp. MS455]QRR07515.1 penicillin-binding protein 2 [Burkholderia sp. MS455]